VTNSWGVCSLIGQRNANRGLWGTDLGYTARARDQNHLTVLFGDTWASPVKGCQYPGSSDNDLQATLPAQRPAMLMPGAPEPPVGQRAPACSFLEYEQRDPRDVTSWPHIRLFPSAAASSNEPPLDLSGLRTPIAAFSDGERILGLFQRFDPVQCGASADCPSSMQCTTDPNYRGAAIGECTRPINITPDDAGPDYCTSAGDCVPGASCAPAKRGVCLAAGPFEVETPRGRIAPSWYRDDPKRAISSIVYVAAAIWRDRPSDYATLARFATNRFSNATARTVSYFDPHDPEKNDYSPGYHTLLIWGRNTFVETAGAQALPFLLYVPLDELRGPPDSIVWRPRFFAGYGRDGTPQWSEQESDAKPIYNDDARLAKPDENKLEWDEPEFDQVAQMSLSWVAPLGRWVMLYGGDLPAFMVLDPRTGKARDPVHRQWAPGAIHLRAAPHPWGAARMLPGEAAQGWSSAEPILTRERAAPYLACGSEGPQGLPGCVEDHEGFRPFVLLGALASAAKQDSPASLSTIAKDCVVGEIAREFQATLSGNPIGRLYAPNIIDEWTQEVTDDANRARNERSVELYWNVSTWNPYQVALFKTQLTAGRFEDAVASALEAHPGQ
jgi:hypothetical protein